MPLNFAPIMPPLQQTLWDKTLDTFLTEGEVNFYIDGTTTPKNVYQLVGTGPGTYTYVSLGHTLTLSGIGTFIDANGGAIEVYLWPWLGSPNDATPSQIAQNYYITVYSSTGVFQFDLNNIPGVLSGDQPQETTFETTENVISNPEFSEVLFSTTATSINPYTINVTGTLAETKIAPDWSVITTGSGSIGLYRQLIIDSTAPGNPAYALGINTSGFTQPIILRQRLLTPRIFADEYVSGTFIVQANNGGPYNVTMNYTPSITGTIQQICTGTTVGSGFIRIFNNTPIFITNPGSGSGYIDITLVFPVGASLQISCVQLLGVIDNVEIAEYLQQSPEREADHLFHYWQPYLNFKPIPSLLTGWDFALNPQQFGITSFSTTPIYVWDQTICASQSGTINVSQPITGAFRATTTSSNQTFYMLQYLDSPESLLTAYSDLSVNINAYSAPGDGVVARVYLFYGNASSTFPSLSTPATIGTIDAAGEFTLTASNWFPIPQDPVFSNMGTLTISDNVDLGFTGWNNLVNYTAAEAAKFAIVVTFFVPVSATQANIQSISCVPGKIPTRPAPQTSDEVLRECQYYYETSYPLGTAPGTANTLSTLWSVQGNSPNGMITSAYGTVIGSQFKVVKRGNMATNGQVNILAPTSGTALAVDRYGVKAMTQSQLFPITAYFNFTYPLTSPSWVDQNGYSIYGNTTPFDGVSSTTATQVLSWHFVADARIGEF